MVIQCPWLQPPRYSCHGTPKPVCWWHHQICHLPCRPCSISRWRLAQWEHLALRSLCVRYSWLPMSMFSPRCLLPVHQALCHSLTTLISLQQRLYCISASLWPPTVFGVSAVFSFKVCLHWANMFFHFVFCLVILHLRCLFWTAT